MSCYFLQPGMGPFWTEKVGFFSHHCELFLFELSSLTFPGSIKTFLRENITVLFVESLIHANQQRQRHGYRCSDRAIRGLVSLELKLLKSRRPKLIEPRFGALTFQQLQHWGHLSLLRIILIPLGLREYVITPFRKDVSREYCERSLSLMAWACQEQQIWV